MVEGSSLHNFFEQFNQNGLLFIVLEYFNNFYTIHSVNIYNIKSIFLKIKIEPSAIIFFSYSLASFFIFSFFLFFKNTDLNNLMLEFLKKFFLKIYFLIKNLLYFFTFFLLIFSFYQSVYFVFDIFCFYIPDTSLDIFENNTFSYIATFQYENFKFFSTYNPFFFIKFDESYVSIFVTFFFILLLNVTSHRSTYGFLIPNKIQMLNQKIFFFFFYVFYSNLGNKIYSQIFFRIIYVLGLLILFFNIEGMLHYLPTITSSLINTIYLSAIIFFSIFICLLAYNSIRYFLNMLYPAGANFALAFLLIPIELISYVFRLISLSVRLFANMMAGHTLLKVIASFVINLLSLLINSYYLVFTMLVPILLLYILTNLEIGVSLIQTYIFVILSSIYIKDIFYEH